MLDIDDTLINGHQTCTHGFEHMNELYKYAFDNFCVHIVTARPDDAREEVKELLRKRDLAVSPDRLHMLDAHLWKHGSSRDVEAFKWDCFCEIAKSHSGVVARFGDMLWDVADLSKLHDEMSHVQDTDCCIFMDPSLGGCLSCKLPGKR